MLSYITVTMNRGCGGAFGQIGSSVARRLNFVYYSKISIKLNKPSSKPSKPTISTYQAKQASFRCEKFQASKLRLSSLACLLNSKSGLGTDIFDEGLYNVGRAGASWEGDETGGHIVVVCIDISNRR